MLLPSLRVLIEPLSYGATAVYRYSQQLADKFTLKTRFDDTYSLYRRKGQFIELPRAACPVANDVRDPGIAISCNMIAGPRDAEQARLIREQNTLLLRGESFIVSAGTGTGKSYIACAAICEIKRKTLIIVPKEDLMDQWVSEALLKFTDLKEHEIGIIQADKIAVHGKKVVMAMLHSLAIENRYPAEVLSGYGLVIVDEAHRASADSLSNAFHYLPSALRLGMSATVKRSDGKEQVLYAHIGPVKVISQRLMLTPRVMVFRTGYRIPKVPRRDRETGQVKMIQMPHSPGKTAHIMTRMAVDSERNALIAKLTHMAWTKDRKIAVFCDQLDHITALIDCSKQAGIPLNDMARYIGGMSKDARAQAKEKRVIFATLGACVSVDQELADPLSGQVFKAEEAQGRFLGGSGEDEKSVSLVESVHSRSVKECVRLHFATGTLDLSTDHLIRVDNGWAEAGALSAGDWVHAVKNSNVQVKDIPELSCDDMWLLGALVGDGASSQPSNPGFINEDADIVEAFRSVLADHAMQLRPWGSRPTHFRTWSGKKGRGCKSWLAEVLDRYSMRKTATDKTIPIEFMSLPDEKIRHLVAGLIDTDGCVSIGGHISFSAKNRCLVEQFRFLIQRLGLVATASGFSSEVWNTGVSIAHVRRAADLIPLRCQRKKHRMVKARIHGSELDMLPPLQTSQLRSWIKNNTVVRLRDVREHLHQLGYAASGLHSENILPRLVAEEVIRFAGSENCPIDINHRWLKVKKVEALGPKPVIDLSMSDGETFSINDIIVHNCKEGTDIPSLDTAVLAAPRADVEQAAGRILREYANKKEPLIIDLVDDDSSVFNGYWKKRRSWYLKIGATIQEVG